ncbi:SOS-response transcriptional repressor, LexA [Fodinibius roseus]|uniref:SOS-response transcriptional repressor, LexA n=1 Tax=Fodinibius roseus TaxID=1194090 RepID=A0A1M5KIV4_9BACT|nr:S24 family peptidase [Fodinibius roseus]SHG52814.1 SOS-response transcriptional repressor, LexA [Fodinibius roseus]
MAGLTNRQAEIFQFILQYLDEHGSVPDYPEIMERFSFKHANSVYQYFDAFVRKNFLEKVGRGEFKLHSTKHHLLDDNLFSGGGIPIRGRITAGELNPVVEEDLGTIPITVASKQSSKIFGLQVDGISMTGVGIDDRDYILVEDRSFLQNGEIGLIRYNGESTLKTIWQKEDHILLEAHNKEAQNIIISPGEFEEVTVIGKYVGKAQKEIDGWHLFLKA